MVARGSFRGGRPGV